MIYICGFAVVNKGKHCWINGHCAICKIKLTSSGHAETLVSMI